MVFVTQSYKLEELAREAGVSARAIRYYVQRGLLPAPEFRGKDTAYGQEHLFRLMAIKKLQQSHLPLEEIQVRLANASEKDLLRIGRGEIEVGRRNPLDEQRDTGSGKLGRSPYREDPLRNDPFRPSPSDGWGPVRPMPLPFLSSPSPTAVAHVYRLAPGVELWVRDGANAASRALAREILERYATLNDKDDDR